MTVHEINEKEIYQFLASGNQLSYTHIYGRIYKYILTLSTETEPCNQMSCNASGTMNGHQIVNPMSLIIFDQSIAIRVEPSVWDGPDFWINCEENLIYRLLSTSNSPHIEVILYGGNLGYVATLRPYAANDDGSYEKSIINAKIEILATSNRLKLRFTGMTGPVDFNTIKSGLSMSLYHPKPLAFSLTFEVGIEDIPSIFNSPSDAEAAQEFVHRFAVS